MTSTSIHLLCVSLLLAASTAFASPEKNRAEKIEGEEKAAVLDKALGEGPVEDMPIRAVLRSDAPLAIYWCP